MAALGIRLALHRENRARAAALGAWSALTVVLLVLVSAVPAAIRHVDVVRSSRSPIDLDGIQAAAVSEPVAFVQRSTLWHRRPIEVIVLDGVPTAAPVGVSELPGPGEMVVSPALSKVLTDPDAAAELAARLPGTITDEIDDAGLTGPEELIAYVGVQRGSLTGDQAAADLVGWGIQPGAIATEMLPTTITWVFATLLIVPMFGLFVSGLGYGTRRREAVLHRLKNLGARPVSGWVLVAAEAAPPVAVGVVAGFLLTPFAASVIAGVFPVSVRPFASSLGLSGGLEAIRICLAVAALTTISAYVVARNSDRDADGDRPSTG